MKGCQTFASNVILLNIQLMDAQKALRLSSYMGMIKSNMGHSLESLIISLKGKFLGRVKIRRDSLILPLLINMLKMMTWRSTPLLMEESQ